MVTFEWDNCDAREKVRKFEMTNSLSWVVLELTSLCNFNCVWCYANSNTHGRHMSKKDSKRIIRLLADNEIRQITYSGGEPLMYPYIKDVVREAHEYGMIVHMNTNGYFLTKKIAEELRRLGLSQVQIDIDSLKSETHDRIRGKSNSFYKAVNALKNAKEVGITCVCQTVLTKINEKEVLDIFKFARSLGIQRCRVSDMIHEGRAIEKSDMRPTDYMKTLQSLSGFSHNTGVKSIECGDPIFPLNYKDETEITGGFCPATKGMFTLISNYGSVYFCGVYRKLLYNIFNLIERGENLKEFHKMRLEKFLESNIPSKCGGCRHYEICRGGCPARRDCEKDIVDYWCNNFN
ncbi:MAG: radical SAM protein [Nanoarchaeota archaeon]|nr:radical SAM protein [Nanoarchaeota archaeon]